MTRHDLLTYMRGRENPIKLGTLAAAMNASVFTVSAALKDLEARHYVAKPARGFYTVTDFGRTTDFDDFAGVPKNCPTNGSYQKRTQQKIRRYYGPTKDTRTIEQRIADICSRTEQF